MKYSQAILVTYIAGMFLVPAAPVVPNTSITPTAISSGSIPIPNPMRPNEAPRPPCERCVTVKMYLYLKTHELENVLSDWETLLNEWQEDKKQLEQEIKVWREPKKMENKIKPDEMRENIRRVEDELAEIKLRIGRMMGRLKKMEMRLGRMDVETILGKKDASEYEHDNKELMDMSLDMFFLQDDIWMIKTWDDEDFKADLYNVAYVWRNGKHGRRMGYHVLVDGPLGEEEPAQPYEPLPEFELVDDAEEFWRVVPTKEVVTEPEAWKRLQGVKFGNRLTRKSNLRHQKLGQLKRKLLLGQIG